MYVNNTLTETYKFNLLVHIDVIKILHSILGRYKFVCSAEVI